MGSEEGDAGPERPESGGPADPWQAELYAQWLARLQEITSRLLVAETAADVAAALAQTLAMAPPGKVAPSVEVWLMDGGDLELGATSPSPWPEGRPQLSPGDGAPGSTSVLARSVATRRPAFSPAALHDPGATGIGWACLPMIAGEVCFGAALVAYPHVHRFGPEERELLVALSDQAALALGRVAVLTKREELAQVGVFFAGAARVVAEASDFSSTLDRLAELALAAIGDICLIDVMGDDGQLHRMVARHRDRSYQRMTDRLKAEFAPDAGGSHPVVEVIQSGRPLWSRDMTADFLRTSTRDGSHLHLVEELHFRSYLAVPLMGRSGAGVGALTLVSTTRRFGPDDVSFAMRLADQVAAVVDNARRYDAASRTSHVLQQSLLPRRLPTVDGLDVETRYLPATQGLEVGGDFFDMAVLPSGRIGFGIGDVAGHDRGAAAMMGQLRSVAKALAVTVREPSELVAALQSSWDLLDFDRMATALFGRVDLATGDLVVASAGHPPPLLVGPGFARYLDVEASAPLGAPANPVVDFHGRLDTSQVLLLYTDGVLSERLMGTKEAMTRLVEAAAGGGCDPWAVCDRVVSSLAGDRDDDVALLALQRRR
ncbi:MAG: GAF domain-containing SpoIIE family protein phosphatase [Acidimicrobiales bacterium]